MSSFAPETKVRSIPRAPKELVASIGFLLARLGFGYKAKAMARVEEAGFDTYDYGVLATLDEGVQATQATIADALALDPSRLVALLDSLEERGLIARQRDTSDRRRYMVSITAAGKKELAKLRAIAATLEDEFLAPLDTENRETLHRLLQQLAAYHDPRCAFSAPPGLPEK